MQAQFVRAGGHLRSSGSAAKQLRHFMKAPPGPFVSPLTVPGTPPSLPGSPVLSQPPYSRGGDPRQRATPIAGPRSASVASGGGRCGGVGRLRGRSSLLLSLVQRPTGSFPRMWCTHFRSCVKNSRHSVDTVTSGGNSSNRGPGHGDVYPRGGICAGCCCHDDAAIFFLKRCCCCLDLKMLRG